MRCFGDPNVIHVDGSVNPLRDISVIDTELIFADLDTISKRYNNIQKTARSGDKSAAAVFGVLERVKQGLESGKPVRELGLTDVELALIYDFHLITAKKVMYVANVDDSDLGTDTPNAHVQQLIEYAKKEGSLVVQICGKLNQKFLSSQEEKRYFQLNGHEVEPDQ